MVLRLWYRWLTSPYPLSHFSYHMCLSTFWGLCSVILYMALRLNMCPLLPLAQTGPLEHILEDVVEYCMWNSVDLICNVLFEFPSCCRSSPKNSIFKQPHKKAPPGVSSVTGMYKAGRKWACCQNILVRKTLSPLTCLLGYYLAANNSSSPQPVNLRWSP